MYKFIGSHINDRILLDTFQPGNGKTSRSAETWLTKIPNISTHLFIRCFIPTFYTFVRFHSHARSCRVFVKINASRHLIHMMHHLHNQMNNFQHIWIFNHIISGVRLWHNRKISNRSLCLHCFVSTKRFNLIYFNSLNILITVLLTKRVMSWKQSIEIVFTHIQRIHRKPMNISSVMRMRLKAISFHWMFNTN